MGNFFYFILIGALAGWASGKLIKGESFGLAGNIIVGIVGGVLGGWIFAQMGIAEENIFYQKQSDVMLAMRCKCMSQRS